MSLRSMKIQGAECPGLMEDKLSSKKAQEIRRRK